jgi:hypothetical protein
MSNLANGYHSLHHYEDALKLREEIFEVFKAKYGPDDYDRVPSQNRFMRQYP